MELLIMILVGIVTIIFGYQFIKKFNRIDTTWFGNSSPDYEPFGKNFVLAFTALGAVIGILQMAGLIKTDPMAMKTLTPIIIESSGSVGVITFYFCCAYMPTWKTRIGKWVFLIFSFALGLFLGAIGSFVVVACLVLYLLLILLGALTGGKKSNRYELSDGTIVERKSGLLGDETYHDVNNSSRTFDRSGDTFHER